jgi:hypothetical protein
MSRRAFLLLLALLLAAAVYGGRPRAPRNANAVAWPGHHNTGLTPAGQPARP